MLPELFSYDCSKKTISAYNKHTNFIAKNYTTSEDKLSICTICTSNVKIEIVKNLVLIVENRKHLSTFLNQNLLEQGFNIRSINSGSEAIPIVRQQSPDLIVIDDPQDVTPESILPEIRRLNQEIPVIILSSKSDTAHIINIFKKGASDYIVKPFNVELLMAKIKALLGTMSGQKWIHKVADLTLDDKRKEVVRGGAKISLTFKEFNLLKYLIINKDIVLTRDMILNRVWNDPVNIEPRIVDIYIGYLRKKIDKQHEIKLIRTIRGFGYQIKS